MITDFVRDAAATAAIFGLFASAWFGWAQEDPPSRWRAWLIAGSVTGLVTALAGGLLTWRLWDGDTVFDANTSRAFGVVVGLEVALAVVGVVVLAILHKQDLSAAWVAFVVGVHLFPVAALLHYPLLYVVATVVTAVAIAAVPVARSTSVAVSAVTGSATGVVLLTAALVSLVGALRLA